jgi:ATP-dependent DNA helicase RecQ
LEAECVLLYSGQDFLTWKFIIEKSAAEPGVDPSFLPAALRHLEDMSRYARGAVCRHRALVQHFGQSYPRDNCGACDLCLGDTEIVADATLVAQKILSCVARVKERFGIGHVVSVLRGENTENVRKRGHEKLSTYGLLREYGKDDVRDWVYQLIGQGVLVQHEGEYPILQLNEASWAVMRGQQAVRLVQPVRRKKGEKAEKARADAVSWEGVDRELFEALRGLRRQLAEKEKVPPYIIFSDTSLRELAGVRPSTAERMRLVYGVGEMKLRAYGDQFLEVILAHCRERRLSMDNRATLRKEEAREPEAEVKPGSAPHRAFELFRLGASTDEVMRVTGRAASTVHNYLCEFIRRERPRSISAWVRSDVYQRTAAAARQAGTDRLKPVFIALGEQVSYEEIRLVMTHLQALAAASPAPTAGAE